MGMNTAIKNFQILDNTYGILGIDRPLYNDHNAMKALVESCEILKEVEKVIGIPG